MNQDFINRKLAEMEEFLGRLDADLSSMMVGFDKNPLRQELKDLYLQSLTEAMEEGERKANSGRRMFQEGYAAALDDVEREMPEEKHYPITLNRNTIVAKQADGHNLCRTAVFTTLSRLRGEKK
jgi:hypothetical protein